MFYVTNQDGDPIAEATTYDEALRIADYYQRSTLRPYYVEASDSTLVAR